MASKRVEAETISSFKALALKSYSILSENSPSQSKSQGQPDSRKREDFTSWWEEQHLCPQKTKRKAITISVDAFKYLNTDTAVYAHSG